jgi:hypothetical protein
MEQKIWNSSSVYNALLPLGMSSSDVPLLAQPFFRIATPSPSARTSAQVSSAPDLEREELEKFAEHNASLSAYLLQLQPIEPLAQSPTSEQKTEELEEFPPAPLAPTLQCQCPQAQHLKKKKLKKIIANNYYFYRKLAVLLSLSCYSFILSLSPFLFFASSASLLSLILHSFSPFFFLDSIGCIDSFSSFLLSFLSLFPLPFPPLLQSHSPIPQSFLSSLSLCRFCVYPSPRASSVSAASESVSVLLSSLFYTYFFPVILPANIQINLHMSLEKRKDNEPNSATLECSPGCLSTRKRSYL